jgi:hypothetical protein
MERDAAIRCDIARELNMRGRHVFGWALSIVPAIIVVKPAAAQSFDVSWFTLDCGGATASVGGSFQIGGTIGQPDAGPGAAGMSGGAFMLTGGFWPATVPSPCPADLDGDGMVGQSDLGILLAAYGTCPGDPGDNAAAAALGGDACVTQADLGAMLAQYGQICP